MIAPPVTRKRFTTREYEQIIAAGVIAEDDPVELLEGEIVEMSPIGPSHSACIDRLNQLLQRMVGDSAIVRVQSPIRLSEYSAPQPDLTLLQPRHDFYASGHPEPEDILLLIEVSESSLSYDRAVKLPLFALAGIPEVFIVTVSTEIYTLSRHAASSIRLTLTRMVLRYLAGGGRPMEY